MNTRPTERVPIKRPARAREMQDALNHYIYHPLAWQLARALAPTPLTPNMVSVFGGLLVVAAGAVYFTTSGPLWAILGMALHLSWHVVDGADGDLARITGKTSPLGELIDGICDYVSHIVLYVLLAFVLTRAIGPGWAWFWTLSAGASHIVQANHVEVQRRFYQYWTYGVPWLQALEWRCAWLTPTEEEIKLALIERGVPIGYAAAARVEEEAAPTVEALARQRSRWFRDHVFYLTQAPRLIGRALRQRQWRQAEAGLAHLVMSSHTLELMGFVAFAALAGGIGSATWRTLGFTLLAGKLVLGVQLARGAGLSWRELFGLAWRLPLLGLGWLWGVARHLAGAEEAWSHTRHRG